jgi:hypothetical protein
MSGIPTSEQSLRELRELAHKAQTRGDKYLAVILAGVDLYLSLGRELELLEVMRQFESDIRPAVEGTPSAADLERLYHRSPNTSGESSSKPGG